MNRGQLASDVTTTPVGLRIVSHSKNSVAAFSYLTGC
jgi:hypothetical protein